MAEGVGESKRGGNVDEVLMGQRGRNVELSPKTAIRRGTSPWQHFYLSGKPREERLLKEPSLQKSHANPLSESAGILGEKHSAVFSRGLQVSLSVRPQSSGTSRISGHCSAARGGILAGLGFLRGLALTSWIPQSGPHAKSMVTFFLFFFPECKQVYNKTRTGKLTFYSLNFPWEEN